MEKISKLFEDFGLEFARKNEDSFSNLSEIITDMHKILCDDTDTPEEVFVQQLEEFSARIDVLHQ